MRSTLRKATQKTDKRKQQHKKQQTYISQQQNLSKIKQGQKKQKRQKHRVCFSFVLLFCVLSFVLSEGLVHHSELTEGSLNAWNPAKAI